MSAPNLPHGLVGSAKIKSCSLEFERALGGSFQVGRSVRLVPGKVISALFSYSEGSGGVLVCISWLHCLYSLKVGEG